MNKAPEYILSYDPASDISLDGNGVREFYGHNLRYRVKTIMPIKNYLPHGVYKTFYDDKLKRIGLFSNSLSEGEWIDFDFSCSIYAL